MSKETSETGPVPIAEGFFELPSSSFEKPRLVGNRCRFCGETFFPSRVCCRRCSSQDMEEVRFNPVGKLYSFTSMKVKSPHLMVPVPYMVGVVELEGGERVKTLLTDCDQSSLEVGMDMELVIESIGKTVEPIRNIPVGTEVLAWKFRLVRSK
jgi:hypothetical protein